MKALFLGVLGMAVFAGSAQAATLVTFTPGGSSPASGTSVLWDFDTTFAGSVITGPLVQYKNPPSSSTGAPPSNSVPSGTQYLSVLGGGTTTLLFPLALFPLGVQSFSFDWGSLDSYNTLVILPFSGASSIVIPGSTFSNPANGNQTGAATNGLLTVTGTAGTAYRGFTLLTTRNSFEIDNVAVSAAVPEPATWAMMLIGFGAIGGFMRHRARKVRASYSFA